MKCLPLFSLQSRFKQGGEFPSLRFRLFVGVTATELLFFMFLTGLFPNTSFALSVGYRLVRRGPSSFEDVSYIFVARTVLGASFPSYKFSAFAASLPTNPSKPFPLKFSFFRN